MKHAGPCGAIRVGAVPALFAPNAGRRWREHRGLRPVYGGTGGGWVSATRASVRASGRAKCREQRGNLKNRQACSRSSECGL